MDSARAIIEQLGLAPHPEGGWYRETWRAAPGPADRSAGTAILFLLEADQRSHWHRVDAAELWLWHAGDPLSLHIAADDDRTPTTLRLGADLRSGEQVQGLVPAHHWQAAAPARPTGAAAGIGWALASCVVVPGFDFAGFTLAPPDWAPGAGAATPA